MPFVLQLADLARTHVPRNKWVIVPSHAVGRTLGERLALAGTNWLNLRFVTPLDIALRMGAPYLVERGIDPSEEGLGPALMMRLLMTLPAEGGHFRPLADHPTLADALWTTVRELRMAGLGSADVPAGAFQSPAKHAEVASLLAAYEHFLADTRRSDMAGVYQQALAHSEWCPVQPADCWTLMPDVAWAPLQQQLFDLLPGERIVSRVLAIPGASRPRRLGPCADPVPPEASAHPLAFLLQPQLEPPSARRPAPGAGPDSPSAKRPAPSAGNPAIRISDPGPRIPRLSLFHAGGREAEIEEVFRRILALGAPLDQVEIACASSAHVALAWEKALRHEWKVTAGPGLAAASTRPGRALLALCDWIETDFSAAVLRRMLQSGDLGLEAEDEGFTAGQAARLLARAEPGWGRATYALTLTALKRSYEDRAADPDASDEERGGAAEKARQTASVVRWLTGMLDAIPVPVEGKVPLLSIVELALRFAERSTARSTQLDHRAGAALVEHLAELRSLDAFSCPLPQALRFVRERVEGLTVAPERPRPGHLYICALAQAAWTGRPHLFVVGLEEGRVFPAASEDPILLDAERAAISPALRLSRDRIDESVYSVLSRLGSWSATLPGPGTRIPASVTFSYSCRDTREYRETYASWLMLQAFRLHQGDPALSYPDLKRALGEPASCVPRERDVAATRGAWWLRSVVGSAAAGRAIVETTFASVGRGRLAEDARGSERFTEWDGFVPAAGAALDPMRNERAYAVTELEGAAECPFRFFLKRGLGIRPVDARQRDKDIWLDPLTRGLALHELYAALWRRCRDAGRRPSLDGDCEWLTAEAERLLRNLYTEMPAPTTEVYARERKDFLADVDLFLAGECADGRCTPVGLEVSFGRPLDDDARVEPLARPEPIEIALGDGLTFRIAGRIDRIDQVGPSEFEILDYKTGGYWRDDYKGTFNGGRRLQHALYGLAAAELLKVRFENPSVTCGVYYFPSHKGQQQRKVVTTPSAASLAEVLGDLRAVVRSGLFLHAPSKERCRFCDYKGACGPRVHAEAEAKAGDPALAAWQRLSGHE
jgi:ATP-dependent helicase/nuclease subunit B